MSKKLTVAVISDLHCGSTLGLCPPADVFLDDGNPIMLNKGQRWMWGCYLQFIHDLKEESRGGDLFVIWNGDMVDGNHHDTSQILSKNPYTQAKIAIECIDLIAKISDKMFMVKGTVTHVGSSAPIEDQIAEDFDMEKDDTRSSWYQLVADFRGVKFDIAHHTTMGGLPWNKPNTANRIASRALYQYAKEKKVLPNFVVRSHVHQYSDSGHSFPIVGITTPCWQLKTEYIYKIDTDALPDIGGLVFVIENGQVSNWKPVLYAPEGEKVWTEKTLPDKNSLSFFGRRWKKQDREESQGTPL